MTNPTDIKPISYLKARAADLFKHINETHRPVIITQNGEARAVLQDPESYEAMRNTIGILKLIAMGEEDIRNDNLISNDDLFANIEKQITSND
ncbi:MAG TPA: type II toxin-antitoxin system Phd/YefM family antitoxin [Desulfomonilia bacterium]